MIKASNSVGFRPFFRRFTLTLFAAGLSCLIPLYAMAVTVLPSGDTTGVTDVARLNAALASHHAGDKVVLGAGTFYINKPIQVKNFEGTLKGAGEGTTVLGVGTASKPFPLLVNVTPHHKVPDFEISSAYFYFEDPKDEVTVRDMTLRVPAGFVTAASTANKYDSLILVRYISNQADTTFKNLRLEGSPTFNFFLDYTPFSAIYVAGDSNSTLSSPTTSGRHQFKENIVDGMAFSPYWIEDLQGGTVDISKNVITNVKQLPVRRIVDSTVDVRNNIITGTDPGFIGMINVTQENNNAGPILGKKSHINIVDNDLTMRGGGSYALEIGGAIDTSIAGVADYKVNIRDNRIVLNDSQIFGSSGRGIVMYHGNKVRIMCNVISGHAGSFGMDLGDVSNSDIKNNDLTNLVADAYDYSLHLTGTSCSNDNRINVVGPIGSSTIDDSCTGNVIKSKPNAECNMDD